MVIKVNPSKGGFHLRLMATNPTNYVRNIRVIMPGFLETCRENPWHPVSTTSIRSPIPCASISALSRSTTSRAPKARQPVMHTRKRGFCGSRAPLMPSVSSRSSFVLVSCWCDGVINPVPPDRALL